MRLALLLLALLLFPLPSSSQETPPAATAPASSVGISTEKIEEWRETLVAAQQRVNEATEGVAAAQHAYRDARKRRRRGAERADLLAAQGAAEQELAEAEAALPALLEEARREGVPPGVLRQFED